MKHRFKALGHLLDNLVDPAVKNHGHKQNFGQGTMEGDKDGLSQGLDGDALNLGIKADKSEPVDEDDSVMGRFKKIMKG